MKRVFQIAAIALLVLSLGSCEWLGNLFGNAYDKVQPYLIRGLNTAEAIFLGEDGLIQGGKRLFAYAANGIVNALDMEDEDGNILENGFVWIYKVDDRYLIANLGGYGSSGELAIEAQTVLIDATTGRIYSLTTPELIDGIEYATNLGGEMIGETGIGSWRGQLEMGNYWPGSGEQPPLDVLIMRDSAGDMYYMGTSEFYHYSPPDDAPASDYDDWYYTEELIKLDLSSLPPSQQAIYSSAGNVGGSSLDTAVTAYFVDWAGNMFYSVDVAGNPIHYRRSAGGSTSSLGAEPEIFSATINFRDNGNQYYYLVENTPDIEVRVFNSTDGTGTLDSSIETAIGNTSGAYFASNKVFEIGDKFFTLLSDDNSGFTGYGYDIEWTFGNTAVLWLEELYDTNTDTVNGTVQVALDDGTNTMFTVKFAVATTDGLFVSGKTWNGSAETGNQVMAVDPAGTSTLVTGLSDYIILGMSPDGDEVLLNVYKVSTQSSGIIRIANNLTPGSFTETDSNGSTDATPLIVLQ